MRGDSQLGIVSFYIDLHCATSDRAVAGESEIKNKQGDAQAELIKSDIFDPTRA